MTKYRVKVNGPSVTSKWGADMHLVDSPASVTDKDGLLIILTPPFPGSPARGPHAPRRATGPSQVVYPRGGWTKVTITELLEEVA